jgi:hypothetical protein
MTLVFLFCAVVGGTIMVCQLVLSLLGLAGDTLHLDVGQDVGHDVGVDAGHDFGTDVGHDFGADVHAEAAGADLHADSGDFHAHVGGAGAHAGHEALGHGSTWLFAMISFRTVVAAMAFFGLAGLAADAAELPIGTTILVALAAGFAAMYGVYWMFQLLARMRSEGTVRLENALGRHGTVYLRIPGGRSGVGKIQLNLQNRTMEYLATTAGPELPTGAKVVVVQLVTPDTLEVQPVSEAQRGP